MIKNQLRAVALISLVLLTAPRWSRAAEFSDEIERDFTLRSIGRLHVTNARGALQIQGWALDKIRVKAKRRAEAETVDDAKKLLSAVDIRFSHSGDDIEVSGEYGRGLALSERVKEREQPRTSMDIVIYAPANLALSVWTVQGKASVKRWNSRTEVRTAGGPISVEDVKGENLSMLCPNCSMEVRKVRATVRCIGGGGAIDIAQVEGEHVYVETDKGNVRVSDIQGEQLYVSKSGSISGKDLQGRIEFHTASGQVSILDARGYLSGRTESGDILAKMRAWQFSDKALIESVRGSVSVTMPSTFSGDVEVWSVQGKASVAFPVEKLRREDLIGPEPANRFSGRIGRGGELLKIYSETGSVSLLRGSSG
jgi:DUF4097 and DUF4098 domain-containing protein YvlB